MLKCYILDDEQQAVDALIAMLRKKFGEEVNVVGSHTDPTIAMEEIETLQPDVLFLDVEMPLMSGLEVLKYFPQRKFNVIFTTAHEKYALSALKAAATDYVLKPLSPQDVYDALQKCMKRDPAPSEIPATTGHRIALSTSNELLLIDPEDIIRIEADNNYSLFYFTNRPKLLISKTLKDFEIQLEPLHFFRIHQSHLINLHHVESVKSLDGGYVILRQGHKVEISRRRKSEFLKKLKGR
jgi:two-component system LytT family response regulator